MSILMLNANSLNIPLADQSVNCVVTSPPYWGLRDYGVQDQLGLEPTPAEYVANMVEVFREVKRVLRDDGSCWINLGDSYMSQPSWGRGDNTSSLEGRKHSGVPHALKNDLGRHERGRQPGIKPKDLVGIPWRVAFALQEDGWYLRSDIIWSKPNPMPESVTDRPTKAHEYIFLLTKQARYYYDAEAVREENADPTRTNYKPGKEAYTPGNVHDDSGRTRRNDGFQAYAEGKTCIGRNRRTVWTIATEPTPYAHFATYPRALVEPCIKAGTSERGVCPVCGAPWVRVTEVERVKHPHTPGKNGRAIVPGQETSATSAFRTGLVPVSKTIGWQPTCQHDAAPVPAVVLDPFGGSGTTAQVARELGRSAVICDLSFTYLSEIARKRLGFEALDAWTNGVPASADNYQGLPLFQEASCTW